MVITSTVAEGQVSVRYMVDTLKVLVIDDDVETTDLLKIILEPNAFEVLAAHSGPEGLDLVRETDPDVIILDLLMPGMDGLMVCKELRQFSNVPILVLSAVSRPGIVAQALNEGADDYLTKPMKSSVLIAHLNKLARRAKAEKVASQASAKLS